MSFSEIVSRAHLTSKNVLIPDLPDGSIVVSARCAIKAIVDVPLRIDHPTVPEPLPALFGSVKVVNRLALRPRRQMRRNVNVKLICNRVDVGVLLVPPQAATRSRAVSLVHVVEDRLCSGEVVLLACHVVYGNPARVNKGNSTTAMVRGSTSLTKPAPTNLRRRSNRSETRSSYVLEAF